MSAAVDVGDVEEYAVVARENLARIDAADTDSQWFFNLTMEREGEVTVIQHDPQREKLEQRNLVLVDGETPTAEQLQTFREEEEKRLADQEEQGGRALMTELVDVTTLALLERAGDAALLSFSPRVPSLEDERGKLKGQLRLNMGSRLIEQVTIENTDEISPAFSVSLDRYYMQLDFGLQQDNLLLQQMVTEFIGSVGFIKSFDSRIVVHFDDYRKLPGPHIPVRAEQVDSGQSGVDEPEADNQP